MLAELLDWIRELEPGIAFLMALPFVVVFAGWLSSAIRKRKTQPATRPVSRERAAARERHVWSR